MSTVVVSSWTFAKKGYGLWLLLLFLLLYVVGREGKLSSGIEAGRVCVYVWVWVWVLCVVCVCVEECVGCLGDVTDIKAQGQRWGKMEGPLEGLLIVDRLQGMHTRRAKNGDLSSRNGGWKLLTMNRRVHVRCNLAR